MTTTQSIYDPQWLSYRIANYVVGKPLWWALQQTGGVGAGEVIENDIQRRKRVKSDYVFCGLVESAAQGILTHQRTKETGVFTDKLYSIKSFRKEFSGAALSDVVLSDLDMKAVVIDGKVETQPRIRLPRPNSSPYRLSSLLMGIQTLE